MTQVKCNVCGGGMNGEYCECPVTDPVAEAMVRVEVRTQDILEGGHDPRFVSPEIAELARDARLLLSALREDGADLAFITGDLLLDVDACAMGTATETHYDVMARDLRKRIAARLSAARTGDTG